MPLRDPTGWYDDLSVHIDDEELIEQAAALEPTLLHGGSRIGMAVWISLVSAIAGAFGGRSAGFVVTALKAFSAALRMSGGFLAMPFFYHAAFRACSHTVRSA